MKLTQNPKDSNTLTRRSLLMGAGGLSFLTIAACTQDAAESTNTDSGSLRFAWWGAAERQALYREFLEHFQAENPDIELSLEPADYTPYVDRLAVQAAGNNLPDLFWVPGSQFLTYAAEGTMFDLNELPAGAINFDDFEEGQVEGWQVLDGKQYSLVYNQISPCIQINRDAMEQYGIDMADDESWDWSDLGRMASEYSQASEDGHFGMRYAAASQQHVELWLRQQGAELFDGDGAIGFDAATLGDWFSMWEGWVEDGSVMPVPVAGAINTGYTEISDRIAIEPGAQSNHFADNQAVTNGELTMHFVPANSDASSGYPYLWFNRICVPANVENPELAAKFLDFFINDDRSIDTIGVVSGPPSNPRLRALAQEKAVADDDVIAQKVLEISDREAAREMRPRYEMPAGGSGWTTLLTRTAENIAVGGESISDAVQALIDELQRTVEDER
ncbi:extracellular solute-binding protein [Pseudactinotalea sp. Z1739]|uniref:ABC transporter substrate-binding protein n=1 Tax=Pseudactinotalea sp. Z1739 TaxID=3413028 RepID=UPI003C7BF250